MTAKASSLIDAIEEIGKKAFKTIPLNSMKETSVTDNVLSEILLNSNLKTDLIWYDNSYKETGKNNSSNSKVHTCADYVLCIKDSRGDVQYYAFQAKNGKIVKKKDGKKGNVYSEITHKVGNKGEYQVDEYDDFLSQNSDINGNYIFYNGEYKDVVNEDIIDGLDGQSFWVLNEKVVEKRMKPRNKPISINDVVKDHTSFIDFLKKGLK